MFVVLLIVDPSSQELGPPAIPGRFKATFTNAPELAYWEHQRWGNKIAEEHPEWFEFEEVDLEPEDKPLTESSAGDLVQQVITSSAFKSIGGKVESLAQSQRIHFWLLVVILAILIFRR